MTSTRGIKLDQRYAAALGWDPASPGALEAARTLATGPDPEGALVRVRRLLEHRPDLGRAMVAGHPVGRALIALAGGSRELWKTVETADDAPSMFDAGLSPLPPAKDRGGLRTETRRRMAVIAAADLTGAMGMPEVGAALSDLADQATTVALEIAHEEARALPRLAASSARLAVIAMGKWGGRELNYASDIDVMFVYETVEGDGAAYARAVAERFMETLSFGPAPTFRVDPDLRPEGRAGPLVRTLESYEAYWDRWALPWEFQALLKARPGAGDRDLGNRFIEAAAPHVYPDQLPAGTVAEIRAMKARSEGENARRGLAETGLKRGVGGIRDIEFAIQLLQLVHGRADPELRSRSTLDALEQLESAGYVHSDDAVELRAGYRWLRDVEHRIQLWDLRQTHEVPAPGPERDRIAKAMGFRDSAETSAVEAFERELRVRRAVVRDIHERLFYRPLLEAYGAAPSGDVDETGLVRQLQALGFLDSEAAQTAVRDMTSGLSRRSRLMWQLLPLMMTWLSESPDPDLGLRQLRLLLTSTPDNAELVALLRDSPAAAERLCRLLGTSRILGRLMDRIPAWLPRLGDEAALQRFPEGDDLRASIVRSLRLRDLPAERARAIAVLDGEHLLWLASLDLLGHADARRIGHHLSDLGDALVQGALETAIDELQAAGVEVPPIAVIAMGKWGGRELNYASDLDAILVYGGVGEQASDGARGVAERLIAMLGSERSDHPGFRMDLGLRPEGRKGPIIRSLDAYQAYYGRWSEVWERQALLRARPAAGDGPLAARFMALASETVHGAPFTESDTVAVRTMKARVETERIPATEDPDFHIKLGPGAMSDIEWVAQLLQLRHGHDIEVRSPSTLEALDGLRRAGHLASDDAAALRRAYRFFARVRNRLYLQAGRPHDSLPVDQQQAAALARSLGYIENPRTKLREDYRRHARRTRRIIDRVFYGQG